VYYPASYLSSKSVGPVVRGFAFLSALVIIVCIHFSPTLQLALSGRFVQFLGSISFAIYLVHLTLLRTVLVWLIYQLIPSLSQKTAESGEISSFPVLQAVAFLAWMALLMWVGKIWRDRVDKSCIIFAKWMEQMMTDREAFWGFAGLVGDRVGVALEYFGSRGKKYLERQFLA
jgi:peptidoglycan/LPS O-acetylase OafA/YrhL